MTSLSLRRAVWDGSVPIKILLDPSECRVFDQSDPYYLHIPRLTYLPIYIPRIYKFFEDYLIDTTSSTPQTAWFEVENAPLKWHWPVGLLYDFYTALDPTRQQSYPHPVPTPQYSPNTPRHPTKTGEEDTEGEEGEAGGPQLPWIITLRFRNYPADILMSLESPTACHDAFMNAIKEADFARNGTAKAVMNLSPTDSKQLWQSIEDHDFEIFWKISNRLLNSTTAPLRNIPIRIYNPETGQVIQALVPPRQTNTARGDPHTLGTALNHTVPILFPTRRAAVIARPVMHGIVLPLNLPLMDLMRDAIYADGFLHITLAMI